MVKRSRIIIVSGLAISLMSACVGDIYAWGPHPLRIASMVMLPFSLLAMIVDRYARFIQHDPRESTIAFYWLLLGVFGGVSLSGIFIILPGSHLSMREHMMLFYDVTALVSYPCAIIVCLAMCFEGRTYIPQQAEHLTHDSHQDNTRSAHKTAVTSSRKRILLIGLSISLMCGIFSSLAAWDHNPQEMYTDDPWQLLHIGIPWAVVVMIPFILLVMMREIYTHYKHR